MIIFTKFNADRRKIVDFFTNSQVLCLGTIFLLTIYNPNFTSFQKCSFFWNSCSFEKENTFQKIRTIIQSKTSSDKTESE